MRFLLHKISLGSTIPFNYVIAKQIISGLNTDSYKMLLRVFLNTNTLLPDLFPEIFFIRKRKKFIDIQIILISVNTLKIFK